MLIIIHRLGKVLKMVDERESRMERRIVSKRMILV
jgi:hypothetical protein